MPEFVSIVGARPQFIKAAVVSRALGDAGVDEWLIHTGQHYDDNMSKVFFDQLGLPRQDQNLQINGGSHGGADGADARGDRSGFTRPPAGWLAGRLPIFRLPFSLFLFPFSFPPFHKRRFAQCFRPFSSFSFLPFGWLASQPVSQPASHRIT